jgi:hypothetical protein
MDAKSIVEALGGAGAVARECGCVVSAVSNWQKTGIPYRHWPTLRRLASAPGSGIVITDDMLAATRLDVRAA